MFRTIERFEETGLGLPYPVVLLNSAEEEINEQSGERVGVCVPDMEHLVTFVALARVFHPLQLSGAEVRFIRQVIGMTATDFAEALDMDKSTFSRWENNRQQPGEWADKQVRQIAVIMLEKTVPCLSIDPKGIVMLRIQPANAGEHPTIELRRVSVPDDIACDGAEAWDIASLPMAA